MNAKIWAAAALLAAVGAMPALAANQTETEQPSGYQSGSMNPSPDMDANPNTGTTTTRKTTEDTKSTEKEGQGEGTRRVQKHHRTTRTTTTTTEEAPSGGGSSGAGGTINRTDTSKPDVLQQDTGPSNDNSGQYK